MYVGAGFLIVGSSVLKMMHGKPRFSGTFLRPYFTGSSYLTLKPSLRIIICISITYAIQRPDLRRPFFTPISVVVANVKYS